MVFSLIVSVHRVDASFCPSGMDVKVRDASEVRDTFYLNAIGMYL